MDEFKYSLLHQFEMRNLYHLKVQNMYMVDKVEWSSFKGYTICEWVHTYNAILCHWQYYKGTSVNFIKVIHDRSLFLGFYIHTYKFVFASRRLIIIIRKRSKFVPPLFSWNIRLIKTILYLNPIEVSIAFKLYIIAKFLFELNARGLSICCKWINYRLLVNCCGICNV